MLTSCKFVSTVKIIRKKRLVIIIHTYDSDTMHVLSPDEC